MQYRCVVPSRFDTDVALRALAHPRRRQMLELVADVERSSSDLARRCRLSKPAASQHLKVLREADLVRVRVDGTRRLYTARADRMAEVLAMLDRFWRERLSSLSDEVAKASEPGP
jgi:DNA-binding transcriptional ArsR family regulator